MARTLTNSSLQITEQNEKGYVIRGFDSDTPPTESDVFAVGAEIIAYGTGKTYKNIGTTASPVWADVGFSTDQVNEFSKAQIGSVLVLTSSGNQVDIDLSSSNNFQLTMSENTTLMNPTNVTAGTGGNIKIIQNAATARTLAFDTGWLSLDGTAQTISTTLSAVNLITYYYDGTYMWYSLATGGQA